MKLFYQTLNLLTKKEKIYGIFILFLLFISSFFELIGISLIFPLLSILVDENYIISNKYLSFLNLLLSKDSNETSIQLILIIIIFVFFLKSLLSSFIIWFTNNFFAKVNLRITSDFYNKYLNSKWIYLLTKNSGTLIRNIHNNAQEFTFKIAQQFINFFSEILFVIIIFIFLTIINAKITISVSILLMSIGFFVQKFSKKYNYIFGKKRLESLKLINIHIIETFKSFKIIKIFNAKKIFLNKYMVLTKKEIFSKRNQDIISSLPKIWIEFLIILLIVFLFYILTKSFDRNSDIIPLLGIFVAAIFKLLPSMNKILLCLQSFNFSKPTLDSLMDEKKNLNMNVDVQIDNKNTDLLFNNKIKLENIDFKYPGTLRNVFKNFSLEIEKNKITGILGESGSGKSTLIDLIIGIHEPNNGEIFIDDKNINRVKLNWQKKIKYVPQDTFLLDDTLKKNLGFGLDEELIDEKKIKKIISILDLEKVVLNLNDGLDSIVGDDGIKLSGGQKQRIGIGRALYFDPEVLILDEFTSALDIETEKKVLSVLKKLERKITIIIISHRQTILPYCDKIIRL